MNASGPMSMHEKAVRARALSKKLTNAKAAAKLRRVAEAKRRRSLKRWDKDPQMLGMVEADYSDLKRIVTLIREGNLSRAYKSAGHLDTAVREEIPLDVWMFIGGSGLHE